MAKKVSFNGGTAMDIRGFNKQTRIMDDAIVRTATVLMADASSEDALEALMAGTITSMRLYDDDDTLIYERTNVEGKITNINTNVYDGKINVDVHITF